MTHISLSASTQRRRWYPCSENSLWRHMLRAHRASQIRGGEKWADTVTAKSIFWSQLWVVAQWDSTASLSLPLSIWKRSLWIRTANLSSCLRVDVSQSILKSVPRLSLSLSLFISCDARNTHQGAVVQESRGEVAVEAERQDVSFPAANSHFVLWQGWDSSEKTVVCYYSDDLNPQEKEAVTSSEPEAQSQVRSLKWGTVSLRSNKRVKTGDYYRSTRPRRGHELWTLHSPDPPWWDGSGAASEIHLQRQRDGS